MIQTLADALAERGYETLTPVQEAVTALELQAADLLVSAQTGSGKTVAFGLAISHTVLGDADRFGPAAAPLALVVAPTRELALQVMRELDWLYAKAGARVVSCVGGMDMRDERRALERGAHLVVGTPGRLRDHIQRGSLEMEALRAVVLDEADEMLDLGFREDLEFMLGAAPASRRTLLFSATVPPMIAALATQFQRDAVRVTTTTGARQHADIAYQCIQVAEGDAENALINLLRFHDAQNALVFANTRAAVNRLTARFGNRGFPVVSLSGELSQTERTHALQAMRDGRARVCVATDVAARGIDLPNLDLVIHAELPSNGETLLHRSGRTGRAGRKGVSALIVTPRSARKAERLLKTARIHAEWVAAPTAEAILRRDEERLLDDPAWELAPTEEQADFAQKLLARHTPEAIAAAYLRLYRSGLSAPEDLSAPDAVGSGRAAPKERKPFGPSAWFAVSVGRDRNAEPRWILPLLCRAGNLNKDSIGAIRVQQTETLVELAQDCVPAFLAGLPADGTLENGVTIRAVSEGPSDVTPPRVPDPTPHVVAPVAVKPAAAPSTARSSEPAVSATAPVEADAPARKSRHGTGPRHPKAGPAPDGVRAAPATPPARARDAGRREPVADEGRKPHRKGPSGPPKPGGAQARKFRKDRPGGKPAATRPDPKDTSQRFERPGKPGKAGKPGKSGAPHAARAPRPSAPKGRGQGGAAPPRRDKT